MRYRDTHAMNDPRIITLASSDPTATAAAARDALRAGGIVAFPTETVYGLAIRGGDRELSDRLFALKGRDAEKRLARYVSGTRAVEEAGVGAGLRAKKLMRAFWPGPVTLVVEDESGETHGFRFSSHALASQLGAESDLVVLGTSANLSGDPPLAGAAEIADAFGDALSLIIDEGRPLGNRASTVAVLPRRGGLRVVREGEVSAAMLADELAVRICFVCTGNTCRSPLAAALFAAALERRDIPTGEALEHRIVSAGLSAGRGSPATAESSAVAARRGVDLGDHRSTPVDRHLVESQDLILTMTSRHRDVLSGDFPHLADRIEMLDPAGGDVPDPFGGTIEEYEACAERIAGLLQLRIDQL